MPKLAPLLADRFTVTLYDRRGRGESGDTLPYARDRELEDLAALIDGRRGRGGAGRASRPAAALALEAAAARLPVTRVVAYEPPYVEPDGRDRAAARTSRASSSCSPPGIAAVP